MEPITVEAIINEPVEKVWEAFTKPEHITKWAFAQDDWHAPRAENDLRPGGRFVTRMEAKDGSAGFDFAGIYDNVVPLKKVAYTMGETGVGPRRKAGPSEGEGGGVAENRSSDLSVTRRTATVTFEEMGNSTHVATVFDPENQNPPEMQKAGWQAILNNFKTYTEGK